MDAITLERIKLLHPKIRKEVLDAYTFINNKLLGKGLRLRFAYTFRTIEEQNALFAQGRTRLFDSDGKRLGIVTQAKGGESIHQYGLAFDIVLLMDKDGDTKFESASWNTILDFDKDGEADWMEVTNYLKKIGYVWGGDWKFKDDPHFEKTFGHTWKTLKKKVDSGDVIKEVINGKTYVFPKI